MTEGAPEREFGSSSGRDSGAPWPSPREPNSELLRSAVAPVGDLGEAVATTGDREMDEIFRRYGVVDDRRRARVIRVARARLLDRAIRDVSRLMVRRAMGEGWTPPPLPTEPWADPLPIGQATQDKLLRWASSRSDFSVRDVQRSTSWFAKAVDIRAALNGLVSRGLLEPVAVQRTRKHGRLPSPRYRVVSQDLSSTELGQSSRAPVRPNSSPDPELGW